MRDRIFREVVATLIHREYLNPYPAKFIIEKDRVLVENSNKAHGRGMIDPEHFSPYPKNPKVAKVLREIGWADELGSGIKNVFKYNKIYPGAEAQFIESDVFKTVIPLVSGKSSKTTDSFDKQTAEILEFCTTPKSRKEIQEFVGINSRTHFIDSVLDPLIERGLLKLTIPDKPTSPKQKYYS